MKINHFLLCWVFLASAVNVSAQFHNPLFIPDTLSGPTYNLTVAPSKVQYLPGDSTDTYGINQAYLGPVLIMNDGDQVQMNVTNLLPDTTTMHWHGMHVAPEDDGGPHSVIPPNTTWSPSFTVDDEATTFWYHPHLHTKTASQVYAGLAGMIIIRDSNEAALNLPRTYGVDDFPLVLQDKSFDADNQFIFEELSDSMMVNGTLRPFLNVPGQMVRFRILNGSNQRVYNIGLPPQLNVFQIGSDGGLLENPLPMGGNIIMAPGERLEIVIDFGPLPLGDNVNMLSRSSLLPPGCSGGPGGPAGGPNNPLDAIDFEFVQFRVGPPTPNPIMVLPPVLNSHTIPVEANAAVVREKVFDTLTTGFPYYINGTNFDMNVVNDTVMLDDVEIWELINQTNVAHPFHIHDIQFYILDINGIAPPGHLAGRKDVVLVLPGDTVRFITLFDDHSDPSIPYMYHCHNLFHEDAGMMGQFLVLDPNTASESALSGDLASRIKVWPNPTRNQLTVEMKNLLPAEKISHISLTDMWGRTLMEVDMSAHNAMRHKIDLEPFVPGVYFLNVFNRKGESGVVRVVKM